MRSWPASDLAAQKNGDSLTDADARSALQSYWNGLIPTVVLGELMFVDRDAQEAQGRVLLSDWWFYEDLATAGILEISDHRDLTAGFTGWGDFMALSQRGVKRTATVRVTEKGRSAYRPEPIGKFERIMVPLFTYELREIVSNDAVPTKVDKYRVVLATFRFDLRSEYSTILKARLGELNHDRKVRSLLKFDPFEKVWKVIVVDQGYKGIDAFDTSRVDSAIQGLR